MKTPSLPRSGRAFVWAALLALLQLSAFPAQAALDLNADGIPDLWAMKFRAAVLAIAEDSDGDGQSNAVEAAAGTDPLSAASAIKVTGMFSDIYGYHLNFPTQPGKHYQTQSKMTLADPSWVNVVAGLVVGTGGEMTATVPKSSGEYFRVLVQDVDSDGDGVSDWEEIVLGFDPNNSHSGGLNGVDDLTAITRGLSATNVVTVVATDAAATEPGSANQTVDTGTFTIIRSGGLNEITVRFAISGGAAEDLDYEPVSRSVTLGMGVNNATVTITPKLDGAVESTEAVVLTVSPLAEYTVGSPATAAVLIGDSITASGTGLRASFYNDPTTLHAGGVIPPGVAPAFGTAAVSRVDLTVNYNWPDSTTKGVGSPAAGVNTDYFSCRWIGEVLPEFSQIYTFEVQANRCARLWVNGQLLINRWPGNGDTSGGTNRANDNPSGTFSATIELSAGVRYPVVLEHFETTGSALAILSWSSGNQPKQVIPQARLFPDTPPQILSALEVLLIKDSGAFTYQIAASANPTSFMAANLPPGWTVNSTSGVITGTPTQVGIWKVPVSASNAFGSGAAVLEIEVIATGGEITRDVWEGVPGTAVSNVPLTTNPTRSGSITSLEVPQSAPQADNFGDRIRGFLTPPVSGPYQFWLTGDDAAELWISNDDEVINSFQRAALTAPTGFRDWPNAAKSTLLYLKAGSRYYVEVRRKEGAGNDHVSVGWSKPGDNFAGLPEVVPAYALSPWVPPTGETGNGTLFLTTLLPQNGALTNASGSSSILLSADETVAIIGIDYSNLSSSYHGMHVHDTNIPNPGGLDNVICDLDQAGDAVRQPDGTYHWTLQPRSGFSVAQLVQHLKAGQVYFNVHSTGYVGGEIKGTYQLLAGSQTFTPPLAPPQWSDDHTEANAAARFLQQATFGSSPADIATVQAKGYAQWIDDQFDPVLTPVTHHLPVVQANKNVTVPSNPTYSTSLVTNAWWENSITGSDQLRQRVAFALSEIVVASTAGPLEDRADALSSYYDMLLDGAFGNFRQILENVTLHPAMGRYLDMLGNDKPNKNTGLHPNENYAREIMQLFSIGLNRMHPDGSLMLNSKGSPIPTYDQDAIIGLAHVFTGWTYNQPDGTPTTSKPCGLSFSPSSDWINPMRLVPDHHYTGQKRLLNNVVIPGLTAAAGQPLDPNSTTITPAIGADAAFKQLGLSELAAAHDSLFNHPNSGPFICRQLIQRLVTSTPSRGYVYRVVSKFNDNGSGVRGDMQAVIKAILLDYEARSATARAGQGYGKQREPLIRATQLARAFPPPALASGTYIQTGPIITVYASNRLSSNQAITLNFANPGGGFPSATSGDYTISSSYPVSGTEFSVRTKDILGATYTQVAGSNVMTVTTVNVIPTGTPAATAHGLANNNSVFLKFTSGNPAPADAVYNVTIVDTNSFQITVPDAVARNGTATMGWSKGGYTIPAGSTLLTFTCTTNHGLATGHNVTISFTGSNGQTAPAANGVFPITVLDATRFTVSLATAPGSKNGTFTAGAVELGANFNRSGDVSAGYSQWDLGTTDTTLGETPLRSPTVFNFYSPDYQFPGLLTSNGLITPEFQLTSETNVVRQSNFIFGGIFSSSNSTSTGPTTGFCSFSNGGGSIAFDIGAYLGNRPIGGALWTADANIPFLIDELNTLLMAGQMSQGMKDIIAGYITGPATGTKNFTMSTTPTPTQKRDRVRAILHLITTSPEYSIQK